MEKAYFWILVSFPWILDYYTQIDARKSAPRFSFSKRALIEYINELNTTWKAEENHLNELPYEAVVRMMGAKDDPTGYKAPLKVYPNNRLEFLPERFDAREAWPFCESIGVIRDQGACGSCYAVAAASAISDRICIQSRGAKKFFVSTQDLMTCCTTCGEGCGGGYLSRSWEYWVSDGLVSGGEYGSQHGCIPYSMVPCAHHMTHDTLLNCSSFKNIRTPQCTMRCTNPHYQEKYMKDKLKGWESYSISADPKQIMLEIFTNGPVSVTYDVHEDFLVYKSGVYRRRSPNTVGKHAVKIIGWGSERGTPYWIVANSWNDQWGENGFFRIYRGTDHCGIESDVVGGRMQSESKRRWAEEFDEE